MKNCHRPEYENPICRSFSGEELFELEVFLYKLQVLSIPQSSGSLGINDDFSFVSTEGIRSAKLRSLMASVDLRLARILPRNILFLFPEMPGDNEDLAMW